MIAQVVKQLVTALKDDSIGINSEITTVASNESVSIPPIPDGHVYGFDEPVNIDTINVPGLAVTPATTNTEDQRSQGRRDSVHTVGFEYATEEPDENKWRQDASYTAEALMRFLDQFNSNDSNYVGSSGAIRVQGWRADYRVTWSQTPNTRRGFALEADILARDTFN